MALILRLFLKVPGKFMNSKNDIYIVIFLIFIFVLFIIHLRGYILGKGLKFYILDLNNNDPFVVDKPTKFQRFWLFITCVLEFILFIVFAIPFFQSFN